MSSIEVRLGYGMLAVRCPCVFNDGMTDIESACLPSTRRRNGVCFYSDSK